MFFLESSMICLAFTLSSLLFKLRAIFSYFVELARLKTNNNKSLTLLIVLINNFVKEFIQYVISERNRPTNSWVTDWVDESNIFFKIVGFFSGFRCWIEAYQFIVLIQESDIFENLDIVVVDKIFLFE